MITFRMATTADIQGSMALINQAKAFLKSKGVDQWQDGYPEEQDIAGDIAAEKGYVLTDGDDMIAYCCIDFGGEPAYEGLKGQWLADGPYVVIHRMAVSDAIKGKDWQSVFLLKPKRWQRPRAYIPSAWIQMKTTRLCGALLLRWDLHTVGRFGLRTARRLLFKRCCRRQYRKYANGLPRGSPFILLQGFS